MSSMPNAAEAPTNGAHDATLASVLDRIDRRLARLEEVVSRIDDVARTAPAVVATVTDTFDAVAARLASQGVDVDERVHVAAELLGKLTSPAAARALGAVLERADVLEASLRMVEQAPGALATLVDTLDGLASRFGSAGVDVDARIRVVLRLIDHLTSPETTSALETLLHSGLLDARSVATLGHVTHALAVAGDRVTAPVGAWGALRALGDRDVQHAVGFLLTIAKQLGHSLSSEGARQLPASPRKD